MEKSGISRIVYAMVCWAVKVYSLAGNLDNVN